MSPFAYLARHRLLLCILVLSVALHLLAIAWFDPRPAPLLGASGGSGGATLALRLASPAAPAPQAAPPAPSAPAAREIAPASPRGAGPGPGARPPAPAPVAAGDAPAPLPAGASASAPGPVQAPPPAPDAAPPGPARLAVPEHPPRPYRSVPSQSVRIDYRITRTGADGPPRDEGTGRLAWESDGSRYTLAVEGVLGELTSEGGLDDTGVAPQRALERVGAGQAETLFDRGSGQIVSGVGASVAQLVPGSQDAASVLVQLAGMGAFDPDQLRREASFWIGRLEGARIERFETVGSERIETGIGALDTVRLQRVLGEDDPVLEVWLAPGHAWLPVQLRLTAPDGTARTQTVAALVFEERPR